MGFNPNYIFWSLIYAVICNNIVSTLSMEAIDIIPRFKSKQMNEYCIPVDIITFAFVLLLHSEITLVVFTPRYWSREKICRLLFARQQCRRSDYVSSGILLRFSSLIVVHCNRVPFFLHSQPAGIYFLYGGSKKCAFAFLLIIRLKSQRRELCYTTYFAII